ncbi:MAG: DMT family transporter [Desulfobacterales bacterium]|nr:DMT family transporter [Desulfobacterales bacterium]
MADAVLLNYTVPMFIPVAAYFWLREPLGRRTLFAVLWGFFGVALILKPGFELFQPAGLVGLASGMLAAVAMTAIRRMSGSEPILRTVFYFSAFGTLVSSLPLAWAWKDSGGPLLYVLCAIGLLAVIAQMFLTQGYSMAPAGQVGPFSYSTVVFAALLGWGFWGETLDTLTLVGVVVTCSAGIIATCHSGPHMEQVRGGRREGRGSIRIW